MKIESVIKPPLPAKQPPAGAPHFNRFATAVIGVVYELLETPTLVTNSANKVVSASHHKWEGLQLEDIVSLSAMGHVQYPLCLDSEVGQLHIFQEGQDEINDALTQKIVRLAIDQVLLVEQLPNHYLLKDNFLYNLLHGHLTDISIIELQAQKLELDLTPPRSAILVDASNYVFKEIEDGQNMTEKLQIRRRIDLVINCVVDFFSLPNDTICASMGQGKIAILKATNTKNLVHWADSHTSSPVVSWANLTALKRASKVLLSMLTDRLRAPITIGIGRHHPGIMGLARSYNDAQAALALGLRFYGANYVHCLDELGMAAFVGIADENIKSDLASHLLSPLYHEAKLLETLHAFFKHNCSPSAAAAALSIHRNSLNYRLDKITSLTGLDPREFDDGVQLRLALLIRTS